MQNPWSALPKTAPYALASDVALLQSFNARGVAPKHQYDTSLFPEPPPSVTGLQLGAGPELASYAQLHRGANPRAPFVSPGKLQSACQAVADRLRSAASQPLERIASGRHPGPAVQSSPPGLGD